MKLRNATYNALNIRGLKELPPPLCKLTGITTTPRDTATSPLLHQASASCGRVFMCLLLTLFLLTFTACEKEVASTDISVHATMQAFYAESRGLTETSKDSVVNYYYKFAGFYKQYPECEADEYFPPTVENLDNAFTHYGIVQIGDVIVNAGWGGNKYENY